MSKSASTDQFAGIYDRTPFPAYRDINLAMSLEKKRGKWKI